MSSDQPPRHLPTLLGQALLLGCSTAALLLASGIVIPSVEYVMKPFGTRVPVFFAQAFTIQRVCYSLVVPMAVGGVVFLIVALLGRGPARLVAISRRALAMLSVFVACLSLYLLSSAGVAYKLASLDQMAETKFYKQTLEQFALLEAAQGRYNQLRETLLKTRDLEMVEVPGASSFNAAEARERISTLIEALPKATDTAMKRRILATLCLFRDRVGKYSDEARDLPRHATEAGAPPTKSPAETLEWIAAHLNQDGWEPLPLFKFSR